MHHTIKISSNVRQMFIALLAVGALLCLIAWSQSPIDATASLQRAVHISSGVHRAISAPDSHVSPDSKRLIAPDTQITTPNHAIANAVPEDSNVKQSPVRTFGAIYTMPMRATKHRGSGVMT
jgi:hypothetical protein